VLYLSVLDLIINPGYHNYTSNNITLFINRFICGVEYTGKLQRMFTDVTVSTDINNNFNDFLRQSSLSLDGKIKKVVD